MATDKTMVKIEILENELHHCPRCGALLESFVEHAVSHVEFDDYGQAYVMETKGTRCRSDKCKDYLFVRTYETLRGLAREKALVQPRIKASGIKETIL